MPGAVRGFVCGGRISSAGDEVGLGEVVCIDGLVGAAALNDIVGRVRGFDAGQVGT